MSAIIEYVGEINITGLESELKERGYQLDLLTETHMAVSSVEAIKSMRPKVLQDVMEELGNLRYGRLLRKFVYSLPKQAEAKLEKILLTPPILRNLTI